MNTLIKYEDPEIKREQPEVIHEDLERSDFSSLPQSSIDQPNTMTSKASTPVHNGPSGISASSEDSNVVNAPMETHPTVAARNGHTKSSVAGMASSSGPQRYDPQNGDQSVQMNDLDLYAASPANQGRPETRNNLKRTIGYEEFDDDDDDDDDEGGPVRSSQERAKRQRLTDRPPRTPQESSDIKIGYHTAEPLIVIFAKFKKGATGKPMAHIYSRKTTAVFPSGKSWSDYVHKNGQVNLEDVTLDPELFPGYKDEFQNMKNERKREVISKYLPCIPAELNPSDDAEAPIADPQVQDEAPMYEHRTPFIVGFHKDYPAVPVRAQLRLQSGNRVVALLFKLEAEDVKKCKIILPKLSVHDTKVKFSPEFARSTIGETKAEILTRFLVKDNEHEDEEVAATRSQRSPRRIQSTGRRSRARSGKGTSHRPQIELPAATADGLDESLESLQNMGQHFLTTAFEYGERLKKREADVLEKESSLSERESSVKHRERTIAEEISIGVKAALIGKEDSAEGLQKQVEHLEKAKDEDNARMQKQIEQLKAQVEEARKQASSSNPAQPSNSQNATRSPASSSQFLNLNGMMFSQAYTQIPQNNPNTGWYWQNQADTIVHHDGPLQGKKFTRNQVLQPINGINVPGRLKETALRCGDVEYLHYEENGIAKLVQNSESVVQHEGRYYVCWTYLREVEEPAFKF